MPVKWITKSQAMVAATILVMDAEGQDIYLSSIARIGHHADNQLVKSTVLHLASSGLLREIDQPREYQKPQKLYVFTDDAARQECRKLLKNHFESLPKELGD